MIRLNVRRAGAAALGSALLVGGLTTGLVAQAPGAAAHEDPDQRPAANAANWLSAQLDAHGVNGTFGSSFWHGSAIDGGLALIEIGGYEGDVATISAAVAADIKNYVEGTPAGDPSTTWAGNAAKSAVFADLSGGDPTSYGGLDLVARLEATVQASGRIEDASPYGDYANVIGQTLAVRALTDNGSELADEATTFLLKQQCTEGWFRQDFTRPETDADPWNETPATEGGCRSSNAYSAPNVDATALAVVLLHPLAGSNPAIDAALEDAVAWLTSVQKPSGAFALGGDIGPNANSTGIAASALRLEGAHEASEAAAAWVRRWQRIGSPCDGGDADAGAVAYDGADFAQAVPAGVPADKRTKWARTASQAIPGLLSAPATDVVLRVDAPPFADAGGTVPLKVRGLAPGERACATLGESTTWVVGTGVGDVQTVKVAVPDAEGALAPGVESVDASDTTATYALPALKVPFTLAKAEVRKNRNQTVTATGLHAGEKVVVKLGDKTVASGVAADDGSFTATFPVGDDLGKAKVTVRGQFADRTNTKAFQVV